MVEPSSKKARTSSEAGAGAGAGAGASAGSGVPKASDLGTKVRAKPRTSSTNRVLVTGGAGFVGSHLCDFLVARGDTVICLDNFFTGDKSNIAHLIGKPNFELIRHDVVEPILLEVRQTFGFLSFFGAFCVLLSPLYTLQQSTERFLLTKHQLCYIYIYIYIRWTCA